MVPIRIHIHNIINVNKRNMYFENSDMFFANRTSTTNFHFLHIQIHNSREELMSTAQKIKTF